MMAVVVDIATGRWRCFVIVLLCLLSSGSALASAVGCSSSRRGALEASTAPVASPTGTPPNTRPALITPSSNTPGADLPPKLRTPPPAIAPVTSPKRSSTAVILGVVLGVVVLLLVSLSAAAFFRPQWLPWRRSEQSTRYERHVPTT